MRVLVVEDERDLAEAVVRGLSRQGFAVDMARDGAEALEKTWVSSYDVIVLAYAVLNQYSPSPSAATLAQAQHALDAARQNLADTQAQIDFTNQQDAAAVAADQAQLAQDQQKLAQAQAQGSAAAIQQANQAVVADQAKLAQDQTRQQSDQLGNRSKLHNAQQQVTSAQDSYDQKTQPGGGGGTGSSGGGAAGVYAVLRVSASSSANLLAQLDQLGTNLLTVTPGNTFVGQSATLPHEAATTIGHLDSVRGVSSTAAVSNVTVRRTDQIPLANTYGISVRWTDLSLLSTLGGSVYRGQWLNAATARYPAVVLGWVAAQRLGVVDLDQPTQVYLGGRWYAVVGVLRSLPLAPEIDRSALIGLPVAQEQFLASDSPDAVYVRSTPNQVLATLNLLPRAANPAHPEQVNVSRPSDALAARAAAASTFTSLFLGLGAVALLVGGVGIANVMVISVLERRSEIGLRRALGATRWLVAVQFLAESLLLSLLGGLGGVAIGAGATWVYAQVNGLPAVVPLVAAAGGLGAALLVGAVAGLYPASGAARQSPTEALRTV